MSFSFTIRAEVSVNAPATVYESVATEDGSSPYHTAALMQPIFVDKEFTLKIAVAPITPICNMFLEFMLSEDDSNRVFAPINDESIVSNLDIYRDGDVNFGIPEDLKMLVAYGLNTAQDSNVANAVSEYHYIKDYTFTGLNWAIATDAAGDIQYEVIYLTPSDIYTNANGNSFTGNIIVEQSGNVIVGMPATIPNMISQLETLGTFNPQYLPVWMTCDQPNGVPLGWIPAVPILYANPGAGLKILNRLQNYFSLPSNNLNYIQATSDRYLWDDELATYFNKSTLTFGNIAISDQGNKYIVFPQQTNFINNGVVDV